MKLEIYNKKGENSTKPVYLKLYKRKEVVHLAVTDNNGKVVKEVLSIAKDGVHLYSYVDSSIGFATDVGGRVILKNMRDIINDYHDYKEKER